MNFRLVADHKGKFLLCMLCFLISIASSQGITNDAEGYFSFDIDANPYPDDSGNGKTGARFQGAHLTTGSFLGGGAFDTTNNGYVNMTGIHDVFNDSSEFTIAFWGNFTNGEDYLFGIGSSATHEVGMQVSGGVWYWLIYNGTGNYCSHSAPSQNTWHHVVLTYDGTAGDDSNGRERITYWLDGVKQSWASCSGTIPAMLSDELTSEFHIGTQYNGGNQFDGFFDEFAVYNRNITVSEIAELYGGGAGYNPYASVAVGENASIDMKFIHKNVWYENNTFQIGDDFSVKINYTFKNITITGGNCNVSLENATTEYSGDDSFTICGSGCEYSSYTHSITGIPTANSIDDDVMFDVCHLSAPSKPLSVNIGCGTSYIEIISAGSIPTCPDVLEHKFNTTFCKGSPNVNVTFTNSATGVNNGHRIDDYEYDRKYSILKTSAPYNSSTKTYDSDRVFEYYTPNNYTITANCSNTTASHTFTKDINIDDDEPEIYHTSVFVSGRFLSFDISINMSNSSDVRIFENVQDQDLSYYQTYIYNSTGGIIYNNTFTTELGVHYLNGGYFKNDTYNLTTRAYDTDGHNDNLTTQFTVLKYKRVPAITITTSVPIIPNVDESFDVDFSVITLDYLKNCTLWTNETGAKIAEEVRGINLSGDYSFNHSINQTGRFGAYVKCWDITQSNASSEVFDIVIQSGTPYYNTTAIDNTNFFNTAILDATTTSGVLMYFFLLALLIGMVVLAEFLRIPAFMILVSILFFFYGLLLYTKISAIIGIMVYVTAVFYGMRGFFEALS